MEYITSGFYDMTFIKLIFKLNALITICNDSRLNPKKFHVCVIFECIVVALHLPQANMQKFVFAVS